MRWGEEEGGKVFIPSLSTLEIWGWIILCCRHHPVPCRMPAWPPPTKCLQHLTSGCHNNQECLQILPNVPREQNSPRLRTVALPLVVFRGSITMQKSKGFLGWRCCFYIWWGGEHICTLKVFQWEMSKCNRKR